MPHTATSIDTRIYVSAIGERARLTADRVSGPGGQRWWSVSLVRADGDVRPVAGQPPIQWLRTREQAREAYRERLASLRAEGWRRSD